jgi:caffeoyl-CoA O-methyltransferase
MKDLTIIPLRKDQVLEAGKYCESNTFKLPKVLKEQLEVTEMLSKDESIMAISPSQCAWLMSFTKVLRPSRGQSKASILVRDPN